MFLWFGFGAAVTVLALGIDSVGIPDIPDAQVERFIRWQRRAVGKLAAMIGTMKITSIAAIGPAQINVLGPSASGTPIVTVTYPVGTQTVLSMQPDGTIETRPRGTAGPYERALLHADRLVYESGGIVYLLPYASETPNA